MLNKVMLMGRLTMQPDLRRTQNGTSVLSFTLAVERDFKNEATGERDADFIDCVAWRSTADFISRWFQKGQLMVVVGSVQMQRFTGKDGELHKKTEIIVDSAYFCDRPPQKEQKYSRNEKPDFLDDTPNAAPGARNIEFEELTDNDDQLPF